MSKNWDSYNYVSKTVKMINIVRYAIFWLPILIMLWYVIMGMKGNIGYFRQLIHRKPQAHLFISN